MPGLDCAIIGYNTSCKYNLAMFQIVNTVQGDKLVDIITQKILIDAVLKWQINRNAIEKN